MHKEERKETGFAVDDGLVIDIQEQFKQFVIEPARVARLPAINETMQQVNAMSKDLSQHRKNISELSEWAAAARGRVCSHIFSALDQRRSASYVEMVAERVELKDLMNADEWAKIHALEAGATL